MSMELEMPCARMRSSRQWSGHPGGSIIALHCSGADGSQWRKLVTASRTSFACHTPSFIGSAGVGAWRGERAFTLRDEATAIIDLIDSLCGPVHLVGHSYGGGVALKAACARPDRVASLCLYEPSAFHLLRRLGARADAELDEIEAISAVVVDGVVTGAYAHAARVFVDYWNGEGTWEALRPGLRDGLLQWLAKAPLEFRALLEDDTPVTAYRRLRCPVLVIRGEHARPPSRLLAEEIARLVPDGRLHVLEGAGHMGPLTHTSEVNGLILAQIWASAVRSETAHPEMAA